ncbi:hypothetical protein [Micromonospora sp. CV4]|uniref:hypothetical protein n=1 Tax=Micromonospora sp. CV4 TaxID=2478711 RepID=UPI0011C43594|nr:hypothetical protein [Micromonospora sp. CV4]
MKFDVGDAPVPALGEVGDDQAGAYEIVVCDGVVDGRVSASPAARQRRRPPTLTFGTGRPRT